MSRELQVWESGRDPGSGSFVVLWPISVGWRILWLTGPRTASFDAVSTTFDWDGGRFNRIA